jgi:hypothetical protein
MAKLSKLQNSEAKGLSYIYYDTIHNEQVYIYHSSWFAPSIT